VFESDPGARIRALTLKNPPSTSTEPRHREQRFGRTRFVDAPRRLTVLEDGARSFTVKTRDRAFRLAVTLADVLAALSVVGLAVVWVPSGQQLGWTALALPVLVPIVHAMNGLYQRDAQVLNKSTLDEAPVLFRAATMTALGAYLISSGLLEQPLGAKVVGFLWMALALCVPTWRVLARAVVRELLPPERCLVLGQNGRGLELAAKLKGTLGLKTHLVGVLPLAVGDDDDRYGLAAAVEQLDVHRVVVAADSDSPGDELEAIQAAKALGVKVSVLPRVLEVVGSSASYDYVDGFTILGVPRFGISATNRLVKRAFDIFGSAVLLALAAPLMLLIAAAVKLTSRGPVCFRQTRIGRNGHAFQMLKFRTMQADAEELKDSLRGRNEQEGLFKIADDPRVTGVGRILRRTSLDELTQLVNVLRGEMSLVGPRPLVPEEDRQIQGWHRRRLHLTPGMTGPWQVLGSARIPMREMVTIDYLYVANWSLWADTKIMLRTVACVVARRGR
jgi:exopolysaccharide biosynthesis polyprenyl glycosylphosphotransferase